jgi:predicted dehydrogenase
MSEQTRRTFLGTTSKSMLTVVAGAAIAAGPSRVRAAAANDRVRFGAVGLGGRGSDLAREFARHPNVEVAYVCDLDESRGGSMPQQIEEIQGKQPQRVNDMRRILDDPDIDGVILATPDNWHALGTIWACQAGKDVYVEKPPSMTVWEGRKMVEAARKYERIVQVGTQNRSAPYNFEARDYIRSGKLGKIGLVKVFNLKSGGPYTEPEDSEMPEGVDYDQWLGPAPSRTFNRGHFHSGWLKYWAYSCGDIGGDGVHQLDLARMLLDIDVPKSAAGHGGNYVWDDDSETPDTASCTFDYGDFLMTFEETQWPKYMLKTSGQIRNTDTFPDWPRNSTRIEIYGTEQMMYVGRHGGGWQAIAPDGSVAAQAYGRVPTLDHRDNMLACMASRELPTADIEEGHKSAVLVHLANILCRVEGGAFDFDAATESVPNHDAANALMTRDYREPYTIPDNV